MWTTLHVNTTRRRPATIPLHYVYVCVCVTAADAADNNDVSTCQQHHVSTRLRYSRLTGLLYWKFLSPVYTIQPVVKPVVQPVVSCKRGITMHRTHAVVLCTTFSVSCACRIFLSHSFQNLPALFAKKWLHIQRDL